MTQMSKTKTRISAKSTRADYKVGYGKPPVEHQFKPGNPGRQVGARNKLGEDFLKALHEDFQEHGPDAIKAVRRDKPDAYIRVIAGLLPQNVNLNVNAYDEATTDELVERIRQLDDVIRPFLAAEGEDGPGGGTETPVRYQ